MSRARRNMQLLILVLGLILAGGTAMAELGCASPQATKASTMPADCPGSMGDAAALSCQPMCLAIEASPIVVAVPSNYTEAQVALVPGALPTRHLGPEPPPPRAG